MTGAAHGRGDDAFGQRLSVHALGVLRGGILMTRAAELRDVFAELLGSGQLQLMRAAMAGGAVGRVLSFGLRLRVHAGAVAADLIGVTLLALRLRDAVGVREVLVLRVTTRAGHAVVSTGGQFGGLVGMACGADAVVRSLGKKDRAPKRPGANDPEAHSLLCFRPSDGMAESEPYGLRLRSGVFISWLWRGREGNTKKMGFVLAVDAADCGGMASVYPHDFTGAQRAAGYR